MATSGRRTAMGRHGPHFRDELVRGRLGSVIVIVIVVCLPIAVWHLP